MAAAGQAVSRAAASAVWFSASCASTDRTSSSNSPRASCVTSAASRGTGASTKPVSCRARPRVSLCFCSTRHTTWTSRAMRRYGNTTEGTSFSSISSRGNCSWGSTPTAVYSIEERNSRARGRFDGTSASRPDSVDSSRESRSASRMPDSESGVMAASAFAMTASTSARLVPDTSAKPAGKGEPSALSFSPNRPSSFALRSTHSRVRRLTSISASAAAQASVSSTLVRCSTPARATVSRTPGMSSRRMTAVNRHIFSATSFTAHLIPQSLPDSSSGENPAARPAKIPLRLRNSVRIRK